MPRVVLKNDLRQNIALLLNLVQMCVRVSKVLETLIKKEVIDFKSFNKGSEIDIRHRYSKTWYMCLCDTMWPLVSTINIVHSKKSKKSYDLNKTII